MPCLLLGEIEQQLRLLAKMQTNPSIQDMLFPHLSLIFITPVFPSRTINTACLHKMLSIQRMITSERGPGRPRELLSAEQVHVQVEDGLPCVLAVVDHHSVPFLQAFLLRNLASSHQQLAQRGLVPLLGPREPGQSVLVLGNDDDVRGGRRGDVSEREHKVVLEDHIAGDLFADQLVEDRLLSHTYILS